MSSNELKSCPFCGGAAETWQYTVRCKKNNCPAGFDGNIEQTRSVAIRQWNTRTPDYKALCAELAGALEMIEITSQLRLSEPNSEPNITLTYSARCFDIPKFADLRREALSKYNKLMGEGC
jgi:hypothetical protein